MSRRKDAQQPSLFDTAEVLESTRPLSHAHDPHTSAEAAENHAASGALRANRDLVLALVRRLPGRTAVELFYDAADHERRQLKELQEVRRRCTDLFALGLVIQGEARKCSRRNTSMVTWHPATIGD